MQGWSQLRLRGVSFEHEYLLQIPESVITNLQHDGIK